jgi:hypothetical protein
MSFKGQKEISMPVGVLVVDDYEHLEPVSYKRKRIVGITAYSLAGIVSAARIAAQKHVASDVVAGGVMGWFIGRYVYETHMSHLAHKHAWAIPMIVPQVDPLQRRYALALAFHPV